MWFYKNRWFCRWDGVQYRPDKAVERDGFCSSKCKQAHHRALKKYVTRKQRSVKDLDNSNSPAKSESNAKTI